MEFQIEYNSRYYKIEGNIALGDYFKITRIERIDPMDIRFLGLNIVELVEEMGLISEFEKPAMIKAQEIREQNDPYYN